MLSRVALVVALGMVLMMMCFALMFSVALPEADYLEVVSVAFIVSFLASLPISFGGGASERFPLCLLLLILAALQRRGLLLLYS